MENLPVHQIQSVSLRRQNAELLPISKAKASLTVVDANQSQQISKIRKEKGEDVALAMLMVLISEVLKYVKHNPEHWTPETIGDCAEMLLETYWHMKIDEFTLCFKRGIKGDYGIIYDKIAYTDIASWLNQYDHQKVREMRRVDQQQVSESTKIENETVIEAYREHYKAWQNRIANKEQIEAEAKQENYVRSASSLVKAMDRKQLQAFRERMKDKGSEVLAVIDEQLNQTE